MVPRVLSKFVAVVAATRHSVIVFAVLIAAFLIRIAFLGVVSPRLDADGALSVDASSYHALACNLVERGLYTSPVDPPYDVSQPATFRPPLTPFLLAAMYAAFGVNLLWGRLGLSIISALSCGLIYLVGERFFGRWTGLLAAMLGCIYPFFLLLVHLPLTETLSIFLVLAQLTLIALYRPRDNAALWAVMLGVLLGVSLLNKAANIVALPCLLLWALSTPATSLKKRLLLGGLLVTVAAFVLLPWTIRNYRVLGFLVPVNTNGGWTLYLGNNPHTEQNLAALEQGTANGWIPPKAVFEPFRDLTFHDIRAYEQRSVRLALQFIADHPATFLNFALRKLKIFWSAYPHPVDALTWYPLALVGLAGLLVSLKSWRRYSQLYVLLVSSMVIPVMFTSMPRFRAPLIPIVLLFASSSLVGFGRWWNANRH